MTSWDEWSTGAEYDDDGAEERKYDAGQAGEERAFGLFIQVAVQ